MMRTAARASVASASSIGRAQSAAAAQKANSSSSSRPGSIHGEAVADTGEGGETDPLLEAGARSGSAIKLLRRCEEQAVYPLIHLIRSDVRATIDTHLTWQELTSVDLNFTIVRPLAIKYSRFKSLAILFALLLNRIEFLREADKDLAFQSVNTTRASLCELLAIKLLRTFSHDGLELVTALTAPFSPFAGDHTSVRSITPSQCTSALELAIYSRAKKFIRSPLCQRCVDGIYYGRVVLSNQANHAIVNDSYKKRPLAIYDARKAPYLDHYRLRVPSIRAKIEFCNFCLLFIFFVLALQQKGAQHWTGWETVFVIWVCGFALDEVAQLQEHGLEVYVNSLENLLDSVFCIISFCYLGIRISGLMHGIPSRNDLAFDCLAIGAILLCPRVASSLIQDNVVLLALKAMLSDFVFFMLLAMICFSGFLYAFWSLGDQEKWTVPKIAWLMAKIWFGNSYAGFDTASSFSPIFGPPLVVAYAILANTLLLTVLISLLSNTFSVVSANAAEEALFQHACKTLLGTVGTDALFSYIPPINLVGIIVVMPASWILSPRWLHKLNVFLIKFTSWPLLLIIRYTQQQGFTESLELTAERVGQAFSWVPLPRSGKSDLDIVEAVFARESASNSRGESEVVFPGIAEDREGSDDDEAQEEEDSTPKTPTRKSMQDYAATASAQDVPPESPVAASVQATPEAPAAATPPREALVRGLGGLSSPLARIFAGGGPRRAPPSDEHTAPLHISQGTFKARAPKHAKAGATEEDLLRAVMEKLEAQEKRQLRIEELLQRLAGQS